MQRPRSRPDRSQSEFGTAQVPNASSRPDCHIGARLEKPAVFWVGARAFGGWNPEVRNGWHYWLLIANHLPHVSSRRSRSRPLRNLIVTMRGKVVGKGLVHPAMFPGCRPRLGGVSMVHRKPEFGPIRTEPCLRLKGHVDWSRPVLRG